MIKYNKAIVKLPNSKLNEVKSAVKIKQEYL